MMDATYWVKQQSGKSAFPNLLWSRPESTQTRGKLLIIGGNSFGFSAVGQAYATAQKMGVGTARVLLPEAVRKAVGRVLEHAEYGASNLSGSFAQSALGEWLDNTQWADSVLIAGDLGRNSETAILIEKFLSKYSGAATLSKDAVDYVIPLAKTFADRSDTTLVLSMAQLQKLGTSLGFERPFRLGMDLIQLVDTLHVFTQIYKFEVVVKHHESTVVAVNGQVSSTKTETDIPIWRVATAAKTTVWRLQNPSKPFEALTTAVYPNLS